MEGVVVVAKICGNCGSERLKYVRGEVSEDGGDSSHLACQNCSTLHFLRELEGKN